MRNAFLGEVVARFAGLRVAVVGDAMCDAYVSGHTDRLCPEAPVPVVNVTESVVAPGGAANTALNLARLGASVRFVGAMGDDAEGAAVLAELRRAGVDVDAVAVDPSRRTLVKRRVLAADQVLVRCDEGTCEPLQGRAERRLVESLSAAVADARLVVVSDYGYGVVTPSVLEVLSDIAEMGRPGRRAPALVVDSKDLRAYRGCRPTAVKPNYLQAVALLGLSAEEDADARVETVARLGPEVLDATGAQLAAVTLGASGALLFERDKVPYRTLARPRPDSAASGAGDTYLAALALAIAAGADTPSAGDVAAEAADVAVSKRGTAWCSAEELLERFTEPTRVLTEPAALERRLAGYRAQGRRVVFTNGCFDILHRGHIAYLERARTLGDILVVGVNSDESIRRLKGSGRPINSLEDRIEVLSALGCVDHVVPFAEDTPEELIRLVRPEVFVKGGDYTRETLPEAPLVEALGGIVEILPFEVDRSTTRIIEKVRGLESMGAGTA